MTDSSVQWPTTIGTIGVIIGVLLVVDTVDDLLTLQWTADDWGRIFAPGLADLLARTTPPAAWRLASGIAQAGLGVFLIVASLALRRRSRRGVSMCLAWAWLAIAWTVVVMTWGVVWIVRHGTEIPGIAGEGWGGYVVLGVLLAFVLLLAYPVFLLVWFSRPSVRAECATWP